MRRDTLLKIWIIAAILVVGIFVMQQREPFAAPFAYQDYYVNTRTQQILNILSWPADVTQLTDIVFFKFNGAIWIPITSTEIARYIDPGTGGISYSFVNPAAGAPTILKKPQTTLLLNNGTQAKMPIAIPKGIKISGLGNVSSITKPSGKSGNPNLVVRLIFTSSPACRAGNCSISPPGAPAPT